VFNQIVTPELQRAMEEFENRFPDSDVPLEMVPSSETTAGLLFNIKKSIEAGKDLLPEVYGWNNDGPIVY